MQVTNIINKQFVKNFFHKRRSQRTYQIVSQGAQHNSILIDIDPKPKKVTDVLHRE